MTDPVNHPPHYAADKSGVECIEVTRWLSFDIGNAVKYVFRAGSKGDVIEDLEKAEWCLNDHMAFFGTYVTNHLPRLAQLALAQIADSREGNAAMFFRAIGAGSIHSARFYLRDEIARLKGGTNG